MVVDHEMYPESWCEGTPATVTGTRERHTGGSEECTSRESVLLGWSLSLCLVIVFLREIMQTP